MNPGRNPVRSLPGTAHVRTSCCKSYKNEGEGLQEVPGAGRAFGQEGQEAAEADQTTFSPASELNRRAKRVSKKSDNPEPAQPSVSAPSSNKKPVKAVSKKTPANSTPSLRQQKLNFAGSNTPVPSASFNLLNQI